MNKVLIVEDDKILAKIYSAKLLAEDFQVEVAEDGKIAIERLPVFQPDLVLLDLMLPHVNGVEVLRFIRSQETTRQLPVVVFTNAYLSDIIREAWKAGANKCLTKSDCTPKQLVEIIRKTLEFPSPPPLAAHIAAAAESAAISRTETSTSLSATFVASSATPTAPPDPWQDSLGAPVAPSLLSMAEYPPVETLPKEPETQISAGLFQSFLASTPATLEALRQVLPQFVTASNQQARLPLLWELFQRVHSLTGSAAVAGVAPMARMGAALEAFIRELGEGPEKINVSTFRTLVQSIEFLGGLFQAISNVPLNSERPVQVAVVDDDIISRRAIAYSLEKAQLPSVLFEDPFVAYQEIAKNKFDLVILDVDMPGLNGYELCKKIRFLHAYRTTPIVFVTNLSDFDSQARSSLCGGNDLIAKPIIFIELAVKALAHILRHQYMPETMQPVEAVAP